MAHHLKAILIFLLLLSSLHLQSQELSSYRWNNRLLLVMSDNPNSPEVRRQISLFAHDSLALAERKLLLLQVFPNHYLMGSNNFVRRQSGEIFFDHKTSKRPFEMVLIGLDGSEKLRRYEIIQPADLYAIIDVMPMRRSE
jgi:hypothetical protein